MNSGGRQKYLNTNIEDNSTIVRTNAIGRGLLIIFFMGIGYTYFFSKIVKKMKRLRVMKINIIERFCRIAVK